MILSSLPLKPSISSPGPSTPGAQNFNYLANNERLTLTYTVHLCDHIAGSVDATHNIVIHIDGTNDGPTAVADTANTDENSSLTVDVIANDTDPDSSDTLSLQANSAALASATANGNNISISSASVSQSGNEITFNPGSDFDFLATDETATVTINYTVTDDDGTPQTDDGTLTITVTGTNDRPEILAITESASLTEANGAAQLTATGDITWTDLDITDAVVLSPSYNDDIAWSAGNINDQLSQEQLTALTTNAFSITGTSCSRRLAVRRCCKISTSCARAKPSPSPLTSSLPITPISPTTPPIRPKPSTSPSPVPTTLLTSPSSTSPLISQKTPTHPPLVQPLLRSTHSPSRARTKQATPSPPPSTTLKSPISLQLTTSPAMAMVLAVSPLRIKPNPISPKISPTSSTPTPTSLMSLRRQQVHPQVYKQRLYLMGSMTTSASRAAQHLTLGALTHSPLKLGST